MVTRCEKTASGNMRQRALTTGQVQTSVGAAICAGMLSRRRRQLTFSRLAWYRSRRTRLAAYPLKLNFLGYRRDRVADLAGNGLQFVGRDPEPPCPRTNMGRIRQIYFVANGRMFDALHGGLPWLRVNGIQRASFHFGRGRLPRDQDDKGRAIAALSFDGLSQLPIAKISRDR
jgi:hypothetical protein